MAVTQEALAARIRALIDGAGLRHADLAGSIGLDPSALSKALSGRRQFKTLEIALIAERLGCSVQALLADDPVPGDVQVAARVQPERSSAIDEATDRLDQLLELDGLLTELGWPASATGPLPTPPSAAPHEQGEALAVAVRESLALGDDDLPVELDALAEFVAARLGVDVAFEPLPSGLDGLSVARGTFRLALVSSHVSATRQRYTLAHEVGHLVAGDSQQLRIDEDIFGRKSAAETRANAFAAAFLMPAGALRAQLAGVPLTEEVVAQALGRYRVSLDALAFRLHNTGIVNSAGRDEVRAMSSKAIALRSGRAADLQARNAHRTPALLLDRALDAYTAGKISVRPLATLLRADPDQLLDELTPSYPIRVAPDPAPLR